jgi:hypothetical protein
MADEKKSPTTARVDRKEVPATPAANPPVTATPASTPAVNPAPTQDFAKNPEQSQSVAGSSQAPTPVKLPQTAPGGGLVTQARQAREKANALRAQSGSLSLYDLQELYANLRDGAYLSALKRAIAILNSLLNLNDSGATALTADGGAFDKCCDDLEKWCDQKQLDARGSNGEASTVDAGHENRKAIPVIVIIELVSQILAIIQKWRQPKGT